MQAFLGGTFNPIHRAHLALAQGIAALDPRIQMSLMPNGLPPHRETPQVSAAHRLAMCRLATEEAPQIAVNDWEITQNKPSFTVDSLQQLRQVHGSKHPLAWVVGWDAFQCIDRWHRWQDLLSLGHLIVCQRGGISTSLATHLNAWFAAHQQSALNTLLNSASGAIYVHQTTPLTVSSSQIREQLRLQLPTPDLAPTVAAYIRQHGLYV
jgi:nicotinate-nucleotide adenylyltransferase